jgi:hypothetical protein
MICGACFKADVQGWLISEDENDANIHWAMCINCIESYKGQGYLLSWVEVD